MKELIAKLNAIPNSYFEFVDSTVAYAKRDSSHLEKLNAFLRENTTASVTDVIYFMSCQPDFFDDDIVENESLTAVVS